ncbi:WD40-repeat-containing domain protein [Leucosporidium creatinivorum]|uniref:WD40-repeat-containing domain protein n=1 Tax=Leucosporidium creatinivorum TaxID=106004 RepID=A0A1Y2G0U3_9BASI|nr:WD40-repeat-containing domain protein [Leucosporidium creatinivorum]
MDVDSEDEAPPQLPPTNTASPASNTSHSSSDNDDDSDDENGQRTAATAQPSTVEGSNASQARSPTASTSTSNYLSSVEQRRALFRPAAPSQPPKGYSIDSIFTISHSTHINALAAPPCLSHLYTGGADGYIRRYALHATLNGTGVDNPAFNNFSMKVGGHAPLPTTDLRQPVLVGYWENEEPGAWMEDLLGGQMANGEAKSKVKWGPKTGAVASQSAVYSLAVQSEELWGLSGTSRGTINLFTIRHDEGHIRHVFRSSDSPATSGHHSKSPVSVLTLANKETSVLSGGWDARILQWDLNTGVATRDYSAHTGQISSISLRPTSSSSSQYIDLTGASPAVSDTSSSGGVAASLGKPVASAVDALAKDSAMDDGGSEADADGEEVDEEAILPAFPLPTTSSGTPIPTGGSLPLNGAAAGKMGKSNGGGGGLPSKSDAANGVPVLGSNEAAALPELSRDVFLSTSVDGQVMIWDRRVKNGAQGAVRRLESAGKNGGWAASATWSTNGQQIYVGRRSAIVEIYDIRHSSPSSPTIQTLRLPSSTGAISAITALPSGRHILAASNDNVRLWDLDNAKEARGKVPPFVIVPGHHGGMVSQMIIDPRTQFMITASGNRGYEGTSTENLVIHQVKTLV